MAIQLKKAFKNKLIELGVYEQWENNVINQNLSSLSNFIVSLNSVNNFWYFINGSFKWDSTPEGYDFWLDISNK